MKKINATLVMMIGLVVATTLHSQLVSPVNPSIGQEKSKVSSAHKLVESHHRVVSPRPQPQIVSSSSSSSAPPKSFDDDDDNESQSQDSSLATTTTPFSASSSSPQPVKVHLNSHKSYIHDFFVHESKNKPVKAASYTDPRSPEGKLKTVITSYGDKISNQNDLKPYTEHIVEENRDTDVRYNDISYKKYGRLVVTSPSSPSDIHYHYASSSKLDVPKFMEYLLDNGFSIEDLDFLRQNDLNYGFDEIERELEKINRDKAEAPPPRTIQIGGEEDIVKGGTSSTFAPPPLLYLITSLVFVLVATSFQNVYIGA
ncbi:hypothetical protein CAAN1_10S05556 [[Candida] anglica]|uniref:Uncharacterized protein n=1 Tax=[Candida] anglica TaxID=148631 RepID=A0ABP0EHB1_9ASCO